MAVSSSACVDSHRSLSPALEVRILSIEQTVCNLDRRLHTVECDVEYLKEENNTTKKRLLQPIFAKLQKQKTEMNSMATSMSAKLEEAVETSWKELFHLQKTSDARQHDWHASVQNDFQQAHKKIESQVKELRENADAATKATRTLIDKEILNMHALNDNLLERLDRLANEHNAVEDALKDVIARQRHVARRSDTHHANETIASASSQAWRTSLAGRCRSDKRSDSDNDTESGTQNHTDRLAKKLRILQNKFYQQQHRASSRDASRDRSLSHETHRLRRSIQNVQTGFNKTQAESAVNRVTLSDLESKVEQTDKEVSLHDKQLKVMATEITYLVLQNLCVASSQQSLPLERGHLWTMLSGSV